jgi:hypothetical protein
MYNTIARTVTEEQTIVIKPKTFIKSTHKQL